MAGYAPEDRRFDTREAPGGTAPVMRDVADPAYRPGPMPGLWWLRTAAYYLHVSLATLLIGIWGLPKAMRRGRTGALEVSQVWIDYMLRAARLHFGVRVEVRGTPPDFDCIVAAKHQSFLDILAIAQACPQRAFIMKREIMRVPIMVAKLTLTRGATTAKHRPSSSDTSPEVSSAAATRPARP